MTTLFPEIPKLTIPVKYKGDLLTSYEWNWAKDKINELIDATYTAFGNFSDGGDGVFGDLIDEYVNNAAELWNGRLEEERDIREQADNDITAKFDAILGKEFVDKYIEYVNNSTEYPDDTSYTFESVYERLIRDNANDITSIWANGSQAEVVDGTAYVNIDFSDIRLDSVFLPPDTDVHSQVTEGMTLGDAIGLLNEQTAYLFSMGDTYLTYAYDYTDTSYERMYSYINETTVTFNKNDIEEVEQATI